MTFLDEIYLEVDGARIAPTACATMAPPAYCAPRATTPTVFARGYYVPTPRRR